MEILGQYRNLNSANINTLLCQGNEESCCMRTEITHVFVHRNPTWTC